MRVAFLLGHFPLLSQTFILDQITGLIDMGVDLDIYAIEPDVPMPVHSDYDHYNIHERTIYPFDGIHCRTDRLIKLPPTFIKGLRTNPRATLASFNFFKYGRESLRLSRFYETVACLDKKPYDIIHAHFGPLGLQGQALREIGALSGKLVTSFHGYDMTSLLSDKPDDYYKPLFDNGDLFLPISNFWRKKLISMGCPPEKIKVHHMGIDPSIFTFQPREIEPASTIKLLSIGRLIPKKGFKYSIRAIDILIKKGYNIQYQIIGDGPLLKEHQEQISMLRLNNHVHMLGWKTRIDVIKHLQDSDTFIVPSVTEADNNMEGIPMVIMEAMAMGVPVISTYHSGIPELIKHSHNGFLTTEKNPTAIADTIETLVGTNNEVLIQNAKETIEIKFNIRIQNKILLQHYANIQTIPYTHS